MGPLLSKLEDIIDFFARDILSLSILVCLFAFLANTFVFAKPVIRRQSSSVNSLQMKSMQSKKKDWQVSLELNAGQKATKNAGDQDKYYQLYSLNTETSYNLNESMNFKGILNYDTSSKNELQNDISDLLLSLSVYKSRLGSNLILTPYLTTTLPLSKDSKQRQRMNFGSGFGGVISGQSKLTVGSLNYAFGLSAHKYFHAFEIAINNINNISYSSNQYINVGWNSGAISTVGHIRHINAWDYSGKTRDATFHLESVIYNANESLSFALGHTNSGSILSPTQEEVEIRLIEETDTMIFISSAYVF